MVKQTKKRALVLDRETVKRLDAKELEAVVGGNPPETRHTICMPGSCAIA